MNLEFERYKLSRFKILTGALQILGSLGLITGFFIPSLTIYPSLGLTTLMFMGVIVRVSIGDSIKETCPAIFFCILNAYILVMSIH